MFDFSELSVTAWSPQEWHDGIDAVHISDLCTLGAAVQVDEYLYRLDKDVSKSCNFSSTNEIRMITLLGVCRRASGLGTEQIKIQYCEDMVRHFMMHCLVISRKKEISQGCCTKRAEQTQNRF